MPNWNIKISNLAPDTTAEDISEWLWEKIGLQVPSDNFSVRGNEIVGHIGAAHIVPLLNRYLHDQPVAGRLVHFSTLRNPAPGEYSVTLNAAHWRHQCDRSVGKPWAVTPL